jgi:integrase
MRLALYRRHRRECKAGYSEELRSSEYDERKKGWKRCECPIFVSGTLARRFRRQTTGQWEWDRAGDVAAKLEVAGKWEGENPPSLPIPSTGTAIESPTVADAIEAFLAKCKLRNIQPTTYAKYQTFTNQLTAYCESRGFRFIDQLTVSDMDRFYAAWKDGIRGKAKKLERLKAFVKFCMKRKWLAEDLTGDLEAPQGASIVVPKAPFTDDELQRLYAACDEIGSPTRQGPGYRTWCGEDAKDFIYLSVYTGLRISDVATFDIRKRLDGNNVFLRMHKTKRPLFTWIPTWLVDRLHARVAANGSLIFDAALRGMRNSFAISGAISG